jgi:molybdopterin synthase catalytic subunit
LDPPDHWTVADLLDHLESRVPLLKPLRGRYQVAVDLEMGEESTPLQGVREVALIPPVSGGSEIWTRLGPEPIDTQVLLGAVKRSDCGAVVLFLGRVRDSHQGQSVSRIDYSAYEALAEKQLLALAQRGRDRLSLGTVALWHRLGPVAAGEDSVAIAVATPHRQQAFEVGQWLIDTLKQEVALWKKEIGPDGAVWMEGDCRLKALQ